MSRAATLLSVVIAEALFEAHFVTQSAFETMHESAKKAELGGVLNAKGKRVQKPVTFFMPLIQFRTDPIKLNTYEIIGRFTEILATRLTNVFPGTCSRKTLEKTPLRILTADGKPEEITCSYIGFDYKTTGLSLKNISSKVVWKSAGETFSQDLNDAWIISQTLKPIAQGRMTDQDINETMLKQMLAWFNDRYITDTYFQFLFRVASYHPQPQVKDAANDGLLQIFANRNTAGRQQLAAFTQHMLSEAEQQNIAEAIQPLLDLLQAFESVGTKPGSNDWAFIVTSDLPSLQERYQLNRLSGAA